MMHKEISATEDDLKNKNGFRLYTVSKRDLVRTLTAFYEKVDETKIKNVERIADKYYMNQIALFNVLEKKYKNEKVILHVSKNNQAIKTKNVFISNVLDVYSAEFDPVKALNANVIPLPCPSEKSLDRLYKYRRLLPKEHPDYNANVSLGKIDVSEKNKKRIEKKRAEMKNNKTESFINIISNSFENGPLSILKRCFLEQRRVKLWIRRLNGIKGTCEGYLEAFDRHFNVVLSDVNEDFLMFDKYELVPSSGKRLRKKAVLKARKRYFKRIFIRGDNVAMVGI
jgi:small nuclear ribonucleoprotein (snRNP)-like protein